MSSTAIFSSSSLPIGYDTKINFLFFPWPYSLADYSIVPCVLCDKAYPRGFQASHTVKTVHAESRRWRMKSYLAKHKKNYASIESNSVKLNSSCVKDSKDSCMALDKPSHFLLLGEYSPVRPTMYQTHRLSNNRYLDPTRALVAVGQRP